MRNTLWLSKNHLANLILLIVFSGLIWALQWIFPAHHIQSIPHLPGLLLHGTSGFNLPQHVLILLGYPVFLLNLFLLFKLNSQYQIVANANFLIAWMYVFVSCTDYRYLHFSPGLLSVSLVLIFLFLLFQATQKRQALSELYFSGLLLMSAALLNAIVVIFIPFVFLALIAIKKFRWREHANFILGIITTSLLIAGILYLTDHLDVLHHLPGMNAVFPGLSLPDYKVVLHDFIIAIFIITAMAHLIRKMGTHKIMVRKHFHVINILLIIIVITYLFVDMNIIFRFYLGIPISFILTHFVIFTKYRYLKRSFLWFMLIMMVISEVLAVFNNLS
ncbi:MAG: DUF6427 family protein [Bacteroidota bacterium]|nr:DUF6427 family protein [Bacteroidota bacterium]